MAIDVKLIKAALEEASFSDPELREAVYTCINELSDDLIDAEYKHSENVEEAWDELQSKLDEIEEAEAEEEEDKEITKDDIDPTEDEDDEEDDEEEDDDEEEEEDWLEEDDEE